jgi:putative esterase
MLARRSVGAVKRVRPVLFVLGVGLLAAGAGLLAARRLAHPAGYTRSDGNRVEHYTLESRLLGRRLGEVAIVPAGGGRRGLLVLLHGRHDARPWSWLLPRQSGPETVLSDALLRAEAALGRRAPVIVLVNGGGHSYYHDRRDGAWGSMVLHEAIPDAVRRFGTLPGTAAIGGISMGGYGALHLASVAPGRFCAVGGHSAALWTSPGSSAPGAFDDAGDFAAHDVFAAARRGAFDRVPVWIDGGSADPFRTADAALVAVLRNRGDRVTYHVWPGAHTHDYWASHMAAYLRFYADALARC